MSASLVAVVPPEPLATFLGEGSYLPRGIPMLKHVLALPGQTVCRQGSTVFGRWHLRWVVRVSEMAAAGHFPSGMVVASLATANSFS